MLSSACTIFPTDDPAVSYDLFCIENGLTVVDVMLATLGRKSKASRNSGLNLGI